MFTCAHVHFFSHTTHAHTHTHAHAHIHTHAHTHTYTHMYTGEFVGALFLYVRDPETAPPVFHQTFKYLYLLSKVGPLR